MLILSYDDYHLDFLKWEHYRNAALAAINHCITVVFQNAFTREEEKGGWLSRLKG